ncbi:hypothetical protein B0H13DRAFT_2287162 [Mycena leptocephala]|nr:hypothetical protein B0H13DRAFT_2287162 [Mycena leptocephala]
MNGAFNGWQSLESNEDRRVVSFVPPFLGIGPDARSTQILVAVAVVIQSLESNEDRGVIYCAECHRKLGPDVHPIAVAVVQEEKKFLKVVRAEPRVERGSSGNILHGVSGSIRLRCAPIRLNLENIYTYGQIPVAAVAVIVPSLESNEDRRVIYCMECKGVLDSDAHRLKFTFVGVMRRAGLFNYNKDSGALACAQGLKNGSKNGSSMGSDLNFVLCEQLGLSVPHYQTIVILSSRNFKPRGRFNSFSGLRASK